MSMLTDHQLGVKAESVFGTPVTVDRFLAIMATSEHDFDPTAIQGEGMQVGAPGGVNRADRRFAGVGFGTLKLQLEGLSKGLGLLISHATGTATSTLVSGTTYQQVFTPTLTGVLLPSSTMQVGIVDNTGAAANPFTYAGCTVGSFELELGEGPTSKVMWTFNVNARSLATATALASASYAASPSIYSSASTCSFKPGGTLTVPTTTTLASSTGTANLTLKAFTLNSNSNIDEGRWIPGGRNQPTVGKRAHTLKLTYEYNDNTFRDLLISQASTSLLIDLQTAETLSTGVATLQVAIPAGKVNSGTIPKPTNGETVTCESEFQILYDGTNQPFYLVQRTADSAL